MKPVTSPPGRRPSAFTLVELLVVIGIISVLIAILLPALSRVRENAAMTVCLANMRQIGVAVNQYVFEYDGYLPNGMTSGANTLDERRRRWYGPHSLGRYWGVTETNFETFNPPFTLCPAYQLRVPITGQPTYTMNVDIMGGVTNLALSDPAKYRPGPAAHQVRYRMTFWRKPTKKVVIIDGRPNNDDNGNTYAANWYYLFINRPDGNAHNRHRRGINALFLDGHAEHFSTIRYDWRYHLSSGHEDQLTGRNFQGEWNSSYQATRVGKLPGD